MKHNRAHKACLSEHTTAKRSTPKPAKVCPKIQTPKLHSRITFPVKDTSLQEFTTYSQTGGLIPMKMEVQGFSRAQI